MFEVYATDQKFGITYFFSCIYIEVFANFHVTLKSTIYVLIAISVIWINI